MLFSSNHINNLLNDGVAVIAAIVSNAVQIMPAYREAGRGYNQCLPNICKFSIMEFGPVLDLKAIGKSDAVYVQRPRDPSDFGSSRPKPDLAHRLCDLCACRTIGLYEQQATAQPVAASIVTDVGFRHPADIERLRHVLSQPRGLAVPILAILRDNSHLERVQAVAVGATFLFPANASVSDISAALAPIIRSTISGSNRPQA